MAYQRIRHLVASIALLCLLTCALAWPSPSDSKSNGTITNESDGTQVWCQPTQWYDIIWFIFANFILHALSVRSLPGERSLTSTVFKLCCFLTPFTGVRRGLCLILRSSNLAGNDLQSAARANALCMVIRSPEWRPKDGQLIEGCSVEELEDPKVKKWKLGTWWKWWSKSERKHKEAVAETSRSELDVKRSNDTSSTQPVESSEITLKTTDPYVPPPPRGLIDRFTRIFVESYRFRSQPPTKNLVDPENVKIHGVCQLAPGYTLSYIPEDIKIYSHVKHTRSLSISHLLGMNHAPDIKLASTHDVPRVLFSLIQTISGGYQLYKARGSQIERYGYTAYGLTVLPYMMVSIINLIGSLLTSEYETIYLVHSTIMDEMKDRGGLCDGVVGTIERPDHQAIVYVDGEEETVPEGETIQFTNLGGEVRCRSFAEKPTAADLAVSHMNQIEPVKEPWPFQKWGRQGKRDKKKTASSSDSPPIARTQLLCVPSHSSFTRLSRRWQQSCLNMLTIVLLILALGLPYVMIAILSGWKINKSTSRDRTFVLNWLICGQVQGYAVSSVEAASGKRKVLRGLILVFLSYGSYSLMGLVVVVQEMIQSGTCKSLS